MYTEGFDELSEAESRPSRTYVSSGGQDPLKLQRENERLRKSLEKEQFFNRLLDQELKDLKASLETGLNNQQQYSDGPAGVSRRSFNILLVIAFALAAFTVYTLLNRNKQPALFPAGGTVPEASSARPAPVTDSVPTIIAGRKSLPAIIGRQNAAVSNKPAATSRAVSNTPDRTAANNTGRDTRSKAKTERDEQAVPASTDEQVQPQQTIANQPQPQPAATQPAPPPAERTVVGKYVVTSKANFYSTPDENTLRSYFISPGADKVVNALEEKNGFIYVEFKNDVGYVTKGWLSKADLTKE